MDPFKDHFHGVIIDVNVVCLKFLIFELLSNCFLTQDDVKLHHDTQLYHACLSINILSLTVLPINGGPVHFCKEIMVAY